MDKEVYLTIFRVRILDVPIKKYEKSFWKQEYDEILLGYLSNTKISYKRLDKMNKRSLKKMPKNLTVDEFVAYHKKEIKHYFGSAIHVPLGKVDDENYVKKVLTQTLVEDDPIFRVEVPPNIAEKLKAEGVLSENRLIHDNLIACSMMYPLRKVIFSKTCSIYQSS